MYNQSVSIINLFEDDGENHNALADDDDDDIKIPDPMSS